MASAGQDLLERRCRVCGEIKLVSDFPSYRDKTDTRCKLCRNEYLRNRYVAHPRVVNPDGRSCSKCGEFKSWNQFSRDQSAFNGHAPQCRDCRKQYTIASREARLSESQEPTEKVCSGCEETKPVALFIKSLDRVDGRHNLCLTCNRDRRRSNKYHIPVDWYYVMLAKQNGGCAVCGKPEAENAKGVLVVDHDHNCCAGDKSCGRCVRSLLCNTCNLALGFVQDSIDHLQALIKYLENQTRFSNQQKVG